MFDKRGLLYFPLNLFDKEKGIANKCIGIIDAFSKKYNIDYISASDDGIYLNEQLIYTIPKKGLSKKIYYIKDRLFGFYKIYDTLIEQEKYDFVYFRFHYFFTLGMLLFFKKIKNKNPSTKIFIEIPTFPYKKELYNLFAHIRYRLGLIYLKFFKKIIKNIVTLSADKNIFGIPTIFISNGYFNKTISNIKSYSLPEKQPFNIGMVANFIYWHAPELLINSLANYSPKKEKVMIHLIGDGEMMDICKNIVKENHLEDYVIFYGKSNIEKIVEVSKNMHVMVGSMGARLKNIKIDSALKSREYAFLGLPLILKTPDPDFPKSLPFVKYFPDDDLLLDIDEIIKFYNILVLEYPNYKEIINTYAHQNLTWDKKLKPIYEAIEN